MLFRLRPIALAALVALTTVACGNRVDAWTHPSGAPTVAAGERVYVLPADVSLMGVDDNVSGPAGKAFGRQMARGSSAVGGEGQRGVLNRAGFGKLVSRLPDAMYKGAFISGAGTLDDPMVVELLDRFRGHLRNKYPVPPRYVAAIRIEEELSNRDDQAALAVRVALYDLHQDRIAAAIQYDRKIPERELSFSLPDLGQEAAEILLREVKIEAAKPDAEPPAAPSVSSPGPTEPTEPTPAPDPVDEPDKGPGATEPTPAKAKDPPKAPPTPAKVNLDDFEGPVAGLRFGPGDSVVDPKAHPRLDQLAAALAANPKRRIELSGHTDSKEGTDLDDLSARRAKAVKDYLVRKGAKPDQIQTRPAGNVEPIDSNRTAGGRARNRRVEVELL